MSVSRFSRCAGLATLSLGLATGSALQANTAALGEAIFEAVCVACHYSNKRDPLMAAPPIAVARHRYGEIGDRAAFVEAIKSFVLAPSEEAARMPEMVEEFGLMPPQDILEFEAQAVGEYLYALEGALPEWYVEEYMGEGGAAGN